VVAANARDRALGATIGFVGGFACVFALAGIAAGLAGGLLSGRIVVVAGGALLIMFGLSLTLGSRGPLAREIRPLRRFQKGAPFLIGVSFGAAWTPCVGPLLGAALSAAAAEGRPVRSGLLLVAYAAGLGLPFVVASLGLTGVESAMAWVQQRSVAIEIAAGVLLTVIGLFVVSGTYSSVSDSLIRVLPFVKGT
jgi:cytochrome c-type biogenesis protein